MEYISLSACPSQEDIYDWQTTSELPYTTGMTRVRGLPDHLRIQFDVGCDDDGWRFALCARVLDVDTHRTTAFFLSEMPFIRAVPLVDYEPSAEVVRLAKAGDRDANYEWGNARWETTNQLFFEALKLQVKSAPMPPYGSWRYEKLLPWLVAKPGQHQW